MEKNVIIFGGNGMIGHHLARKLKNDGYFVRTVDIREYTYGEIDYTNDYCIADLRDFKQMKEVYSKWDIKFDWLINASALIGGAGIVFTGDYDSQILNDNIQIVLNTANLVKDLPVENRPKVFHCSSACMYSQLFQETTENVSLKEEYAYPAYPDSDYGWSKLIEERIFQAYNRNYGIDIRIGRFHNIYGIEGAWNNKKEKAPSALCRKVAMAEDGGEIEIWGDGQQTRSFLAVNQCLEGIIRLMESDCIEPLNIGSDEMVSINDLAKIIIGISGKNLTIKNIQSNALGVRGRNSDNTKIKEKLDWSPSAPLKEGLPELYNWILTQVKEGKQDNGQ